MRNLAKPSRANSGSNLLSPFAGFDSLFDRLFDRFFDQDWLISPFESKSWSGGNLDTDVVSDEKSLTLTIDVPGAEEADLDVTLDGGLLKVVYEKQEEKEDQDEGGEVVYKGRRSGKVEKCFQLPDNVDQEAIAASLKNGVLKLTLPKHERETSKKVEVTSLD